MTEKKKKREILLSLTPLHQNHADTAVSVYAAGRTSESLIYPVYSDTRLVIDDFAYIVIYPPEEEGGESHVVVNPVAGMSTAIVDTSAYAAMAYMEEPLLSLYRRAVPSKQVPMPKSPGIDVYEIQVRDNTNQCTHDVTVIAGQETDELHDLMLEAVIRHAASPAEIGWYDSYLERDANDAATANDAHHLNRLTEEFFYQVGHPLFAWGLPVETGDPTTLYLFSSTEAGQCWRALNRGDYAAE